VNNTENGISTRDVPKQKVKFYEQVLLGVRYQQLRAYLAGLEHKLKNCSENLVQGFPTFSACTPRGTFTYLKEYI